MIRLCALTVFTATSLLCGQERKPPPPETPEIPRPALVLPPVPQRSMSGDAELVPEIKARIEAFFMMLRDQRVSDGYKKLFEGAALAQERPELIKELAVTTTTVLEKCGRLESTEMLRVRGAGRSLREVIYIVNCQKRPMRWKFYAYQGGGRWQILDTNVSLEPAAFFDEPGDTAGTASSREQRADPR